MSHWSSKPRDYSEDYDEPKRKKYLRCADGFCGATDCPRCSPERFRGGVHEDDAGLKPCDCEDYPCCGH